MARISSFFHVTTSGGAHPSTVDCGYQVVGTPEGPLLQLSTYGSDARQSEKKVSQTLQLDRAGAAQLRAILDEAFPGL